MGPDRRAGRIEPDDVRIVTADVPGPLRANKREVLGAGRADDDDAPVCKGVDRTYPIIRQSPEKRRIDRAASGVELGKHAVASGVRRLLAPVAESPDECAPGDWVIGRE